MTNKDKEARSPLAIIDRAQYLANEKGVPLRDVLLAMEIAELRKLNNKGSNTAVAAGIGGFLGAALGNMFPGLDDTIEVGGGEEE